MRSLLLKISFLTFFFTCHYILAGAQNFSSDRGRFSVNINRGCVPYELQITTNYDHIDFEGLNQNSSNVVHYYFFYNNAEHDYGNHLTRQLSTIPDNAQQATIQLVQIINEDFENEEDKFDRINITLYQPQAPQFYVLQCLNNSIQIAIDYSQDAYEAYQIDFGDGTTQIIQKFDPDFTYTYNTGGIKNVSVKGLFNHELPPNSVANSQCSESSRAFPLIDELIAPYLERIEVIEQHESNGQIRLYHGLAEHITYSIEMAVNGSNTFQHFQYVEGGSTSTTIENLDTENNYYCFRMNARNACTGDDLFSNVALCSIVLDVSSENNGNALSWQSSGFTSYQIFRMPQFSNGSLITTGGNSYTDNDVVCNQIYSYRVTGTLGNNHTSTSIEVAADPVNSTLAPPALANVTASIEGNHIRFSWNQPSGEVEYYHISRSVNNTDFTEVGSTTQLTFRRSENSFRDISYQVHYTNTCGNESEATLVRPIILRRSQGEYHDILEWNEYLGWENGVANYYLEISDIEGNLLDEIQLSPSTLSYDIYDPPLEKQVLVYRIIAVNSGDPSVKAFSNILKVDLPVQAHFPNAFTPDDNGVNDEFGMAGGGRFVSEIRLTIINRWGETVFYTQEIDETWNGYFKGRPAPEGTYIFNAEIIDQEGRRTTKKGSILLLRPQ